MFHLLLRLLKGSVMESIVVIGPKVCHKTHTEWQVYRGIEHTHREIQQAAVETWHWLLVMTGLAIGPESLRVRLSLVPECGLLVD